jgi:1,3-propanediol dehydrogenase/alcohol dehydrogenase
VAGNGAIETIGKDVAGLGRKPLILIGSGSLKRNGTFDRLAAAIGAEYAVFENVASDPDVQTVNAGLEAYRQNGCDYIVAAGGGSVLDAAKAIALLAANGGSITDYEFTPPLYTCPPVVAIPTTAGTGSEVTKWSIITDPDRKKKMAIGHEYLMPAMAVLDPEITLSMSREVTAATGMDALTHAIEAYISDKANIITEVWSLKAIALLTKNILTATYNPTNIDARAGMLYGQMFAGIAFNNSSVALVHAMSRPLGAYYGIPHGEANAMLLPAVLAFNRLACADRYRAIAEAIGLETENRNNDDIAKSVVAYISELFGNLPLKSSLREFGVSQDDIPKMAKDAYVNASARLNPRKALEAEVISLYQSIF